MIFWTPHRLPAYELRRANMSRIVVLDGLRGDREAAKVLAAWLQKGRVDGYSGDEIAPFELSAVRALRELAEGRVGKLLPDACKVLDAAKGERKNLINDVYVRKILDVDGLGPSSDGIDEAEESGRRPPRLSARVGPNHARRFTTGSACGRRAASRRPRLGARHRPPAAPAWHAYRPASWAPHAVWPALSVRRAA